MNPNLQRTVLACSAMLLISAHAGLAQAQSDAKPATKAAAARSGFLSDYARLKPVKGVDGAQAWRRDGVEWKKYNKVLIERMQLYLKQSKEREPIDPADLKTLTEAFYEALVTELKPTAQIVDKPGNDVLRIRIAIVDLVPTKASRSLAGSVIPFGFVAEAGAGAASGRPVGSTPYLGQTGIEAQFLDGGSGEVVGEFLDLQVGKKYNASLSDDAAKKWVGGYLDSFSTWGYAQAAFKLWSKLFRDRFDELRGMKPAA